MTQSKFFPFWGQANIVNAEIWSSPTFLLPACLLHSTGGLFPGGHSRVSADSGQPSMDHCPIPNTQPWLATQLTGPERGQGLSKPQRLWEALTTRWSLTSKPWAWAPSQYWVWPGLQSVLSCMPRASGFVLSRPALPLLQAFMGLLCFSNNKRHEQTQGEKA